MDDDARVLAFLGDIHPMSASLRTIQRATGIEDDRDVRAAIGRLIADGHVRINTNGSWNRLRYRIEKEQTA